MSIRYKFPVANDIRYGQDFGQHRGVPSDRIFTLRPKSLFNNPESETQTYVWLEAPGYGQDGNYGNGSICVDKTDLPKPLGEYCCPHCGGQLAEVTA